MPYFLSSYLRSRLPLFAVSLVSAARVISGSNKARHAQPARAITAYVRFQLPL
jgi:hypothetical protein